MALFDELGARDEAAEERLGDFGHGAVAVLARKFKNFLADVFGVFPRVRADFVNLGVHPFDKALHAVRGEDVEEAVGVREFLAALAEKLCADGGAGLPVLVHPGVIGADRDGDDVLVLVHGVGTLDFKLLATHVVHGVLEELERGAEGEFDALAVLAEVVFDDEVDEAVFAAVQRDIHAFAVVHDFHDFLVRGGRDEEAEGERFAEEVELAVIPRGGLVEGSLAVRNLGARAVNHLQRDCFGDAVDGLDGFEKAENSVHCVSPFDMPSM